MYDVVVWLDCCFSLPFRHLTQREHGPDPDRTIFKYLDTSLLSLKFAKIKYYFGMDDFFYKTVMLEMLFMM